MLKKCLIAFTVVALALPLATKRSEAFAGGGTTAAGATSVGAGIYVAGGFVSAVAVICIYDLWLKANGLKNWDGTAKVKKGH